MIGKHYPKCSPSKKKSWEKRVKELKKSPKTRSFAYGLATVQEGCSGSRKK